jgi:hypothetical protein
VNHRVLLSEHPHPSATIVNTGDDAVEVVNGRDCGSFKIEKPFSDPPEI